MRASELAIRRLNDEIVVLERQRPASPARPGTWGTWGMVSVVLVLGVAGVRMLSISARLGLGILAAALALGFYVRETRKVRSRRERKAAARNAELDAQIAAKTAEIENHWRMVRGA